MTRTEFESRAEIAAPRLRLRPLGPRDAALVALTAPKPAPARKC